ncbi:MAG: hypothetical protein IJO06_05615 [Thermoguttaceae bacterium]|nr:hypothetical protein [Thermoguttaceae bacterium]
MIYEELIERFEARDENGDVETILVYGEVVESVSRGRGASPVRGGQKRAQTLDGERLNPVDASGDVFETVGFPRRVLRRIV